MRNTSTPQEDTTWLYNSNQAREELDQIRRVERDIFLQENNIFLENNGVTNEVTENNRFLEENRKPLPPDNLCINGVCDNPALDRWV